MIVIADDFKRNSFFVNQETEESEAHSRAGRRVSAGTGSVSEIPQIS